MSKNIIVSTIVAVVVSALAFALFGGSQPAPQLGGGVKIVRENFAGGIQFSALNAGGLMTVASGSRHFSAAEICNSNVITLNGDGYASAQAQVLPTAANLIKTCLPSKGDYRDVYWYNLSIDENPTISVTGDSIDAMISSASAGTTLELPANRGILTRFTNVETGSISMQTFEFKHQ